MNPRRQLAITHAGSLQAPPGSTIVVNPPNDQIIDNFTIGLCIATFLLAVGTAFLAWQTSQLHQATKDLAEDTVAGSALTDRHHQESLTPAVVYRPGRLYYVPGESAVNFSADVDAPSPTFANAGLGPALDIRMQVEVLNANEVSYASGEYIVGAIAPGTTLQLTDFKVQVEKVPDVKPDREQPRLFRLTLTYKNLFDALVTTVQVYDRNRQKEITLVSYDKPKLIERL